MTVLSGTLLQIISIANDMKTKQTIAALRLEILPTTPNVSHVLVW
jgi:hypothetical protein